MADNRKKRRYELSMELSYSWRRGDSIWFGSGRTTDLSDQAIRFENDETVPRGVEVELRIAWPFRLQSVCPLELVVRGPVVRTGSGGAVLKMSSYEFRTCGERSFDQAASLGTACNVLG
jgi:hypothetical protein